jgi:biopolymer transport protein ExbD
MNIQRRQVKVDVPSVAMGDIAFNLIVFFVILAKANDDSHLVWKAADATQVERSETARATVLIDRENKLYLNAQPIAVAALQGALEQLLTEVRPGKRAIHLKVDREIEAVRFQPVIEAISEAGGELWLITEEQRPPPAP